MRKRERNGNMRETGKQPFSWNVVVSASTEQGKVFLIKNFFPRKTE